MRFAHLTMVVMAAVATALVGCGRQFEQRPGKIVVAVSIAPLADFTREVAGEHADVKLLVPRAASPHTYQLTPRQMRILSKASLLVTNGLGLEFWADKAVDAANNPKLRVIRTADGLDVIDSPDEHDHAGGNPHVWLSPRDAIHQVEAIRDALAEADPDNAESYRENADRYVKELSELDKWISQQVAGFRLKQFVAFHPAWVYFARDYGLKQAAVIERTPGVEASPSELRQVARTVKRIGARAVFAEPQFSPKAARVIAEEAGARVLMLDPLGSFKDYNYVESMRKNVREMAKAMR